MLVLRRIARRSTKLTFCLGIGTLCAIGGQCGELRGQATSRELIEIARDHERTTPVEILEGTLLLLDLGDADAARTLFGRLTGMNLTEPQQVALAREIGTAKLMRLARAPELGDDADRFVEATTAAVDRAVRNPERIADRVARLASDSPAERGRAMQDLLQAGGVAAPACIAALANPANPQQRTALMSVLIRLYPASRGPLLATFDANQEPLLVDVCELSGELELDAARPYLAALAATREGAVRAAARAAIADIGQPDIRDVNAILSAAIVEQLAGGLPDRPDHEQMVEVWLWDNQSDAPTSIRVPASKAGVVAAARLARWQTELGVPLDPQDESRAIAVQLEAADIEIAAGREDLAATTLATLQSLNPHALNLALAWSLEHPLMRAATRLAGELGARGDASVLAAAAPHSSPLVRAVRSGYRPLQVAAAEAIAAIKPTEPFAGTSQVAAFLSFAAHGSGESRVVAAMPNPQQAITLAGQLAQFGYDAQGVYDGRSCVQAALASPDVEFVLLDIRISRPDIRETIFQIRSSDRTARVPIGVLVGREELRRGRQIASDHHAVVAFARPSDPVLAQRILVDRAAAESDAAPQLDEPGVELVTDGSDVKAIADRLAAMANAAGLNAESRLAAAERALAAALDLTSGLNPVIAPSRFESLLVRALANPEQASRALSPLARLGGRVNQRALLNLASEDGAPIETRQQAALTFRLSVQRFGLALTREDILDQYQRFEASRTTDRNAQGVHGHLLNTIEMTGHSEP